MIVIIAEKPSVGRDLARIVGAGERRDGYMAGGGYAVTWAFGHLVEITTPQSQVPWRQEYLPILPDAFYLSVGSKVGGDGKRVQDQGYAHQLEVIKKLFDEADYIINAGDAGREGELIQRYIYTFVGCTKPVKRLWISSMTDQAIREGLANLHDSSEFDTLYAAGKARSEADWLVGINATRALTIIGGGAGQVRSLGRVQTPTLAMVCKRYLEFRDFVPEPFWTLKVSSMKDSVAFKAAGKDRYTDKAKAEADCAKVRAKGTMTVVKVEQKEKILQPPYLHDLTSLQKEANKRYNLPAQDTLDIAQSLYEKKFITYPRTGSKFIPEDVLQKVPGLIAGVASGSSRYAAYAASMAGMTLNRHSVDQTKVTDHHALLPTEVTPSGLSDMEQKIYDLVVCRMLEAMSPRCEMRSTVVEFDSDSVPFVAKGSVVLSPGWKAVRQTSERQDADGAASSGKKTRRRKKDSDEEEAEQTLPMFAQGDVVPVMDIEFKEDKTKPKPLHTEATLLEAMEHAGRELDDQQLKEALKDVGIGTPATRAGEIETILNRGYIVRQEKSLVPTELGLSIYAAVKDKWIANVEMTGRWENSLAKIVDGKVSAQAFDGSIRRFVVALTKEILEDRAAGDAMTAADPNVVKCPKCAGPLRFWPRNVKCSRCGQVYWKELCHKKLSDATMRRLFTTGSTQVLKGFVSRQGNEFSAALRLNSIGLVVFDFSQVGRETPESAGPGSGEDS